MPTWIRVYTGVGLKKTRLRPSVPETIERFVDLDTYLSFTGTMDDIPDGAVYVKTENNYTDADASKLAGIQARAQVNVNADWNAISGDAQILNKPIISGTNTGDETTSSIQTKRPLKTINLQSIEGTGDISIGGSGLTQQQVEGLI